MSYITQVADLAAALSTVRQSKTVLCLIPAHNAIIERPCVVGLVQMTPDGRADWYDKHVDENAVTVAVVKDTDIIPYTVAEFLVLLLDLLNNIGNFPCAVAQGFWKAAPIKVTEFSDYILLAGTTRTESKMIRLTKD